MKQVFFYAGLLTLSATLYPERYTVLYDLGGTLVDTSQIGVAGKIGYLASALYYFIDRPASPRQRIFETLERIDGKQEGPYRVEDGNGNIVPRTMALYLAGHYHDSKILVARLQAAIDRLHEEKFFVSSREYSFVKNAVAAMFDPETIIANTYGLKDMLALFERINPEEHDIIIVSNWDALGFDLFMESALGKRIGTRVKPEQRVVSGKIGINKPNPDFFTYVLNTFSLNRQNCILIDNDQANIHSAAQAVGIPCIHFSGNVKAVEAEFIARGIIKS